MVANDIDRLRDIILMLDELLDSDELTDEEFDDLNEAYHKLENLVD